MKLNLKANSISGHVVFTRQRDADNFYFDTLGADGAMFGLRVHFDKERNRKRMLRLKKILDEFKERGLEVNYDCFIVRRG